MLGVGGTIKVMKTVYKTVLVAAIALVGVGCVSEMAGETFTCPVVKEISESVAIEKPASGSEHGIVENDVCHLAGALGISGEIKATSQEGGGWRIRTVSPRSEIVVEGDGNWRASVSNPQKQSPELQKCLTDIEWMSAGGGGEYWAEMKNGTDSAVAACWQEEQEARKTENERPLVEQAQEMAGEIFGKGSVLQFETQTKNVVAGSVVPEKTLETGKNRLEMTAGSSGRVENVTAKGKFVW